MAQHIVGWASFVNVTRRNQSMRLVQDWLAARPEYVAVPFPRPFGDLESIPAGLNTTMIGGLPAFMISYRCESDAAASVAVDAANAAFEAGGFVRNSAFGSELA